MMGKIDSNSIVLKTEDAVASNENIMVDHIKNETSVVCTALPTSIQIERSCSTTKPPYSYVALIAMAIQVTNFFF